MSLNIIELLVKRLFPFSPKLNITTNIYDFVHEGQPIDKPHYTAPFKPLQFWEKKCKWANKTTHSKCDSKHFCPEETNQVETNTSRYRFH